MQQPRSRRAMLATLGTAATVGLAGCSELSFGENTGENTGDNPGSDTSDDRDGDTEDDRETIETIGMTATTYVPEAVTIEAGETVVWKNTSTRRHTVTASSQDAVPEGADFFASGGYESYEEAKTAWLDDFGGQINTDETYSYTFEVPGTYSYVCIPHVDAGMTGTIVVE